ncbi:hypothetical protein SPRG_10787 [Saprolegnia parasitica CBS 223.65]|uniref:Short transient receptor potential channel 4-associated protein n=1 Tax=Saprolegnia parasitica (strain CBS 223.65) TaxID=695850 RepID=A0A067C9V4_SAPPC|nr:hypothetical protein SPRG_10787 [Saprolegnia parasitica CBS 223.65]KDO23592.1 hypothetical protein SPRG_10787 [Saprolegnia parasitica CBS 223.65]|eukprot:XP_012205740.1 hypothetical protein SPRG_10787 [Saprolegnia parasitica CBS 223.65]
MGQDRAEGRRVRGSTMATGNPKASMFMRIRQAQVTGQFPTWSSVREAQPRRGTPSAAGAGRMQLIALPPIDMLASVMSKTHQRMLKQIRQLEELLDANKLVEIVVPLQTISRSIVPPSGTTTRKDDRDNFIQMGGPEVLLRIIYAILGDDTMELFPGAHGTSAPLPNVAYSYQDESNTRRRRAPSTDAASQDKLTALAESMNFLRELCFIAPAVAERLGRDDHLTVVLFQLMSNGLFFEHAAGLVEEILSIREDSFDLSRVPNFQGIVQSFSTRQLAFFCRILALIVFEPEDRRLLENSRVIKSIELLRLRRERMQKTDNTVDRNHAILFQTPAILHRFMLVLQLQNYFFSINPSYDPFSPELQSSTDLAMLFSLEQHEEWHMFQEPTVQAVMDDAMHGRTLTSAPSDAAGFIHLSSTYFRSLLARSRLAMPPATPNRSDVEVELMLKSISLAPFRVEVLFVICTLLSSKRKVDFQDTFANMGLVHVLTQMFQRLEWNAPPSSPPSVHQPLHGPGCECSMDASLKIQFLRLIHNFCDRDVQEHANKLLLLTPEEQHSLHGNSVLDPMRTQKGLLCQIIDVLCAQPSDSIYRFWLASCVESFLRRASPAEQLFVAKTPLLAALLREILGSGFKPSGSLQSAFDLLGEMTKNNATTLVLFNDALDDLQFSNFMHVVVTNLVDSNVFVRSLLLSIAHRREDMASCPSLGRLFAFLDVNNVRLLRDLMGIVSMDDINHENICCLNTAIVMFVFEHRKARLPHLLHALRQHDAEVGASALCVNFRHLLWFWVQYYTPRGRDRLSLEHSSDMKFREWYDVVALLCADDGSDASLLPAAPVLPASPYALHHQLRPGRV